MPEQKPKQRHPQLTDDEITRLGQQAGLPSEWLSVRYFEEFPGAGMPSAVKKFVELIIEYAHKKRVRERAEG